MNTEHFLDRAEHSRHVNPTWSHTVQIFSFVTGNYSALLGCLGTCVVALFNLKDFFVILQDSLAWIFSFEGGGSGDTLMTLCR